MEGIEQEQDKRERMLLLSLRLFVFLLFWDVCLSIWSVQAKTNPKGKGIQ